MPAQHGRRPTVTSGSKKVKPRIPEPPKQKGNRSRYITFYGQDFFNASYGFTFSVLAGDDPPTIVGGYADWQLVKRPLRRSLTVFQGFDPISMKVTVRFLEVDGYGSWLQDDDSGLKVEKKIEILEWMAGESRVSGPSPFLYLSTFDEAGRTIPLIPFEYQSATGNVPKIFGGGDTNPWVVTGLEWGKAIRNNSGFRIWQDATVTVMYYQSTGNVGQNQHSKARPKATTFVSRAGADTALTIARLEKTANAPLLAHAIVKAPQNKHLHLRSVNQKIKHGKKVVVPSGG